MAALAAAYFLVARLGLMMDAVSGFATLVWPATGLALAVLILLGSGLWPGVWLGAALVNWTAGAPALAACGIAAGNTLEAVLGAWLLRRVGFRPSLERVRDVLALAGLAAVVSTLASASIGVASLLLGGVIGSGQLKETFRPWWLGDLIAALVVAPLLLSWGSTPPRPIWTQRLPEAAALGLVLFATTSLVFLLPESVRQPYLVFLPLSWAALRFDSRYVTLAVFVVSALAVTGTVLGTGPYAGPILHVNLALLQAFMAVVAVTILVLHAVANERGQLLVRETAARAEALDAKRRFVFLADASAAIDAHLDERALTRLAQLSVAYLADWCAIDVVDDDQTWRRVVVAHVDPNKQRAARRMEQAGPGGHVFPEVLRQVVRTRKSVLHPQVSEEWLAQQVPEPEHRALLRELGIAAAIHVPLVAHARAYGVISLVRTRPDRPFSGDDLVLAEDLARRAAHAAEVHYSLHRTEEARRLLRAVIEGTSDHVFAKDRLGRYLLVNSAGARCVGRTAEEIVGKDDTALLPEPMARALREADRRVMQSGVIEQVEEKLQTPDGDRLFWTTKAPFRDDGHVIGVVGIARDITDRKRAEEALRESDRRKGEFLAMLSHELRNPLAPIRSSLYVLDRAPPGGEQARRAQRVIDRQVAHMTRLVDDLLDVTRISRGKLQLKRARIDLNALIRSAVDDQRDVFSNNGIALESRLADQPHWVDGDSARLGQVVGNLLQNAAKFTSRGGRAVVSVERSAAGTAIVRIRDTGIGMAPDMLERLFEPFAQAEKTLERSRGGLGLGLSLVKAIVKLHGGDVSATSAGPGQGAEFVVSLPLAEAAHPTAAAPSAGERSRARRVLVIEDNVDAAESLEEALELDGHDVEIAFSGTAGIDKAREFRPDVILCDIGLPGLDGYAVARALRADASLSSISLIALSGYAAPEDVERSREAGFETHLAKPPDLSEIESVLALGAQPTSAPGVDYGSTAGQQP